MKIIFCGYGRAALECFYQLLANYEINQADIIVFTHNVDGNEEFIKHVKNNDISFTYKNINESFDSLSSFSPDFIISIYYRYIINKEVLELVSYKAMNSHPSLLPMYRGTKSSVWAILNNETETGITYHYINEKIDDGNIILQARINIKKTDTAYSLYHKLITLFSLNFCNAFELLIAENEGYPQIGKTSYYTRKLPYNGILNFEQTLYSEAHSFVRAMYFPPFKGAMFSDDDGKLIEIENVNGLNNFIDKFKK